MSVDDPDRAECYAIARNEFRDYSRFDLLDWAVEERASDFVTWPMILHDYLEYIAGDEGISYEDAAANAIHSREGVAAMRVWARDHAPGASAATASPAGVVRLIERLSPDGIKGWQRRPPPPEAVSPLRSLARLVRRVIGRWRL